MLWSQHLWWPFCHYFSFAGGGTEACGDDGVQLGCEAAFSIRSPCCLHQFWALSCAWSQRLLTLLGPHLCPLQEAWGAPLCRESATHWGPTMDPLFKHALPISSLHHTVSWLLWRDGMRFLASVSPRWLSTWHLLGPQLSCRGSLTWLAYPFVRKLETQKLLEATWDCIDDKLVLFSCSVVSDSLQPQGLQHTRLPCPSPSPGACPNACPLSRWCHPTISSSVVPFSSCLQSFPASGSFLMSQLFESHGRSIGASASASALPMNIQDWFPLGLTSLISLQSKGLSRVFSNTTVLKHHFFNAQPSLWSSCHVCTWLCQVGDDNWHIGEPVSCPEGREASSSVAKSGCGSHVPRMPAFPE